MDWASFVNREFFYITKKKVFLEAKKRTVPNKPFSPIFDCLWVADQDPGFSTSQTTLNFFRDCCFRFYRWLTLQEATEMKFNWWILRRLIWNLTRLGWKQPLLITPGIYSIVFHDQITQTKTWIREAYPYFMVVFLSGASMSLFSSV